MENILNKNILRFNVSGAVDFSEDLTIEIYGEKQNGSEEFEINEISKIFRNMYPIISDYIRFQFVMVATDHHHSVRPRKVWIKCIEHFLHTHDTRGKGRTTNMTFNDLLEKLKNNKWYELDLLGNDIKSHTWRLRDYFGEGIIVHGKKAEEL